MKKILYIPVEVKSRELRAKILLATEMANRGFKTILGTHWIVREAAQKEPGILLDKDASLAKKEIFVGVTSKGGKVYVQDEEMILPSINEELAKYRVPEDIAEYIKGYFLTSEYYSDLVKNRFPNIYIKSYVVGNSRIDLLGNNIRYYYKEESDAIKKKYGRYILVNSAFTNVNELLFRTIETHSKVKMSEEDKSWYYKYGKYCNENKDAFINSIVTVADRFDMTIVVRPHPGENVNSWLSKLEHKKNVIVSKEGDANAWNYGAEFIIHNGCTTALEAYLIGKKSVIYQPRYDERYENHFIEQLSERATSEQELCQVIEKYLSPNYSDELFFTEEKKKLMEYYLYNPAGGMAVKRIADILEADEFEQNSMNRSYSPTIRERLSIYKNFVMALNPKAGPTKFGYTSPKEMDTLIEASKKVLGISANIKVKRITNNIFMIG